MASQQPTDFSEITKCTPFRYPWYTVDRVGFSHSKSTGKEMLKCESSLAFITPAKSHSDVIVAAVASRDLARAKAYAKKFDIPNVHGSYQGKEHIQRHIFFYRDGMKVQYADRMKPSWTIRPSTQFISLSQMVCTTNGRFELSKQENMFS